MVNPGALMIAGWGLRDALESYPCPWVEVHLSNVWAREPFRHESVLSSIAHGVVAGLDPPGIPVGGAGGHRDGRHTEGAVMGLLGIDIGGTKVAIRLETDAGERHEIGLAWPSPGNAETDLEGLGGLVADVVRRAGEAPSRVAAAVPATTDADGVVSAWPSRPRAGWGCPPGTGARTARRPTGRLGGRRRPRRRPPRPAGMGIATCCTSASAPAWSKPGASCPGQAGGPARSGTWWSGPAASAATAAGPGAPKPTPVARLCCAGPPGCKRRPSPRTSWRPAGGPARRGPGRWSARVWRRSPSWSTRCTSSPSWTESWSAAAFHPPTRVAPSSWLPGAGAREARPARSAGAGRVVRAVLPRRRDVPGGRPRALGGARPVLIPPIAAWHAAGDSALLIEQPLALLGIGPPRPGRLALSLVDRRHDGV